MTPRSNPLAGWRVDAAAIRLRGEGLQRPACVLAEHDGTLWTSDARGAVRLGADGRQELLYQRASDDRSLGDKPLMFGNSLPNGLAFDPLGRLLVANIGAGAIERMARDGRSRTLLDAIAGRPLGRPVSVVCDSRGRIWFSAMTSLKPWIHTMGDAAADGYLGVIDERGARIVADGFRGVGEIRFDADEAWLYCVEPRARRIVRLRVGEDAACARREVFGPADLGGMPSGLALDVFGNLLVSLVLAERLVALTPEGEALVLLDGGNPQALRAFDSSLRDDTLTPELMAACRGPTAPWMGGIAFGGPGLSAVYLGSLAGRSLAFFETPTRGLPLPHRGAAAAACGTGFRA